MKDKYCEICGKKFPPQHSTGYKDVDKMLAEVTKCTKCLIKLIKEVMTKDTSSTEQRVCKCGCGKSIEHKHPNTKFYNKHHKDKYWNMKNPRGNFAHLKDIDNDVITVTDEWGNPLYEMDEYAEYCHPFSSEGLGQE